MLADPQLDCCHLPARPPQPKVVRPYDWNAPSHLPRMLKAARIWIRDENLRAAEWNEIAPFCYDWLMHDVCAGEPPTEDPAAALQRLKPENLDVNDFQAYRVWLLSWLEYCLPGSRQAQRAMLDEIGRQARR